MKNLRNRVYLIGHLGQDPEVKEYETGKRASFSIATNKVYTNRDGEKVTQTQWHRLVVWDKLADIVEKYLAKGKQTAIEGELVYRSYKDESGEQRHTTDISVDNLLLL